MRRANRIASARQIATVGSSVRVRQAAIAAMVVAVSAWRASTPRSTVRSSAVSALMARVRSLVICSRATVNTRSAVRAPVARGQRSCCSSRPRTAWATAIASRVSLLPVPRRRPAATSGASATTSSAVLRRSVSTAP